MATMNAPARLTQVNVPTKPAQIRVAQRSPAYWRVTLYNPPINVMGPEMVKQFQEVINALEADEQVRVVVFDSAVDNYFLNHSDFMAKLEDLTSMPAGPTGLPPWPDFLVRLTRLPVQGRQDSGGNTVLCGSIRRSRMARSMGRTDGHIISRREKSLTTPHLRFAAYDGGTRDGLETVGPVCAAG